MFTCRKQGNIEVLYECQFEYKNLCVCLYLGKRRGDHEGKKQQPRETHGSECDVTHAVKNKHVNK